jgi:hypothetical protein
MRNILFINLNFNIEFQRTQQAKDFDCQPQITFIAAESFYKNRFNNIELKPTYTPSVGDKLYFLKGINIPRVKMKNITAEYKVKTVRDIKEATHIFGSNHTFDKISSTTYHYRIYTDDFKLFVKSCEHLLDKKYADDLNTVLEFYTEPEILLDYHTKRIINLTNLPFDYKPNTVFIAEHPEMSYSDQYFTIDPDMVDVYNHVCTTDIYDQSALLIHLNGDDAIEIEASTYKQLSDMFDSSDQDNHILAMEIMANSDYSSSLLYLELLFMNYGYKIDACATKRHVNFKSLTSFLHRTHFNITEDVVINTLVKHGQVTKENLDILFTDMYSKLENRGCTSRVKVKTITIDAELLEGMNENYEFEIRPEFQVKEMIVEEIVPETPIEIETNESTDNFF